MSSIVVAERSLSSTCEMIAREGLENTLAATLRADAKKEPVGQARGVRIFRGASNQTPPHCVWSSSSKG